MLINSSVASCNGWYNCISLWHFANHHTLGFHIQPLIKSPNFIIVPTKFPFIIISFPPSPSLPLFSSRLHPTVLTTTRPMFLSTDVQLVSVYGIRPGKTTTIDSAHFHTLTRTSSSSVSRS